ncbi:tetratricopeptide repeat protein [Streptomyces aurantiacus]|uniref:Putative Transmembrane and TPR repeat-containing protein n=1 Tax=Streptomyces aurantiacus JA 4570 TaxID=1286094 RepID=S3ZL74_9ACTN|nr:tetratricopeptide repeat protein [Streptomyces aurantiacus]EPH44271.1 putative Transmembrane and TPR repeat-containing protein [Streptomyces aurantiacus JA 4570]
MSDSGGGPAGGGSTSPGPGTGDGRDEVLAEAVRLRESGSREEARALLIPLSERFPDDAEVAYQTAWVHDTLGLEAEALPHYQRAIQLPGLSDDDRRGALLGLGSTYRVLSRYEEAVTALREASEEYPDDGALKTFLAMALYNTGHARDAMGVLLRLLAATSRDPDIASYRPAIEYYAKDLDETV